MTRLLAWPRRADKDDMLSDAALLEQRSELINGYNNGAN